MFVRKCEEDSGYPSVYILLVCAWVCVYVSVGGCECVYVGFSVGVSR